MALALTKKEFLDRLRNVHSGKIKLVSDYEGKAGKYLFCCITCRTTWEAYSGNVLNGHGCPPCSYSNRGLAKRKTQKDYERDVFKVHGNKVTVLGEYLGGKHKILHRCNVHEIEWEVIPESIVNQGSSCFKCAQSKRIKSGLSLKTIRVGSRSFKVQGAEGRAIRYLVNSGFCSEKEVVTSTDELPTFSYQYRGKTRTYFPDIQVRDDTIIEVKAEYFFSSSDFFYDTMRLKALAVMDSGYKFGLILYVKGRRTLVPKNWWKLSRQQLTKLMEN